jgi:hypothetical protein
MIEFLRTPSMQCDPHVASIQEIEPPPFNVTICMGAMDKDYDFEALKRKGKVIYYCCEASNPDWWPKLNEIKDSVDLIVNVDGNDAYKDAHTTLAIYGQKAFDRPWTVWSIRPIPVGWCGGYDPNGITSRDRLLRHFNDQRVRLGPYPMIVKFPFIELPNTYHLYADFLMNTKFVINCSGSSGDKSHHVKGRVLEAGLAGCCLLEDNKSPISKWFSEDCYFTYNEPEDCELLIRDLMAHPEEAKLRAANLRHEVIEKYNPKKLWTEIFELCG